MGPISPPAIRERVARADLVLALGTELTDMNLGAAKPQVARETLGLGDRRPRARLLPPVHRGRAARLRRRARRARGSRASRARALLRQPEAPARRPAGARAALGERSAARGEPLPRRAARLRRVRRVGRHAVRRPRGARAARPGSTSRRATTRRWASACPAALGAQIGTGVRPLVLCGDGAFQMTGPEISHAPRLGLSPIVVLMNNGGWGIFRPVSPRQDLLAIPNWPYAELAQGLGRRRLPRGDRRRAARRAARRARGEGLRADRGAHRARRPLAGQPPLHPGQRAQGARRGVARRRRPR